MIQKILSLVQFQPANVTKLKPKTKLAEYRLCRNLCGFQFAEHLPYPEKSEGLYLVKIVNYKIESYQPYFLLRELMMDMEMMRQRFEKEGTRVKKHWQYGFTVELEAE